MKKGIIILLGIFLMLFVKQAMPQQFDAFYSRAYSDNIYAICNYSRNSINETEFYSVKELIQRNFNGFYFYIEWDDKSSSLMLKNPNGTFIPFIDALESIRQSFDSNSKKIITLFLDYSKNVNVNELIEAFVQTGLSSNLYAVSNNNWPKLDEMVELNQRLVVFSMHKNIGNPAWMHYIWDYAVEPFYSSSEGVASFEKEYNGNIQNDLLVFDWLKEKDISKLNTSQTDSIGFSEAIQDIKTVWINTGKTPNFIFFKQYDFLILPVLSTLREFKTVRGTLSINSDTDYVNWNELNSATNNKFCFPLNPNQKLSLEPICSGYSFKPKSITIDDNSEDKIVNFTANELSLTDGLDAKNDQSDHLIPI